MTVAVGIAQLAFTDDRAVDIATVDGAIRSLAEQGAQLIVLPELHGGHYFCKAEHSSEFDRAERVPGPTTERLGALAAELGVVIVGSVFERRAAGLYHNTAVVLDADGRLAGTYRKMHIPDDPGYYEKYYFTPGDLGFEPITTAVGRLGVLVCWDQWYPEAARLMALAGAELLIYPTAIGWDPSDVESEQARQRDAWTLVQRGHAVANGLPVVSVNRVGDEVDPSGVLKPARFWGASFVAGPQGELLSQLDASPTNVVVQVDLERSELVRRSWPFLRDRRIDAYGELVLRYRDR